MGHFHLQRQVDGRDASEMMKGATKGAGGEKKASKKHGVKRTDRKKGK